MRQNVIHLQKFYASPLGRAAQTMVMRRLTALWEIDSDSGADGKDMLGFGYATPYLAPYGAAARRVILAMPGGQGGMITRSARGNVTCMCEEDALPFPPASFDRILVAHGLEESPDIDGLLEELWRIMKPEGRLVLIAANRSGLWAGADNNPFGSGRPFSRSQLSKALKKAQFAPMAWSGALYVPPATWLMRPGSVSAFERFGETVSPRFSGLVLVEAIKRLYADTQIGISQSVRRPKFVGTAASDMSATDN